MDFIFPKYPIRIEHRDGKPWIWDVIRKKWLVLQKEEYVRQHLVHYLMETHGIPAGRMGIEKEVRYGDLRLRFDLVVFDREAQPFILCECKAPEVAIGE
ncbi:MAG: type I restriction enzyme HsdR N-terminal domain-containing protein, partial [Bacteroidetes bacterium]